MLKWLLVVGVAIVAVPAPFPRQAVAQNAGNRSSPQRYAEGQQEPAAKAVPVAYPSATPDAKEESSQQTQPDKNVTVSTTEPLKVEADVSKDWRDKANWILSALLVFIAFCGVMYARSTLKAMQIQADDSRTATSKATAIAQESADAALMNAKAVIDSERPWLVVTVESPSPNRFVFKAKNVGRTPAKLVTIFGAAQKIGRGEKLPVPPNYAGETFKNLHPRLLPSGDARIVYECNIFDFRGNLSNEDWLRRFQQGFELIYSYGKVVYTDLFTPEGEKPVEHETLWCFYHLPLGNALPTADLCPPEYNDYT